MPDAAATAEEEVRDAWRRCAGPHRLESLERLLGHHREPHRHYHTVRHVAAVLQWLDRLLLDEPPADDHEALLLAVLYHDAVYDPTAAAGDNERASALLAARVADDLGWPQDRARRVHDLIVATAGHVRTDAGAPGAETDHDTALLLDADLAVLAAEPSVYEAYRNGVRREYAHLDDATWRAGRSTVLHSMLARPWLFHTATMRHRSEVRARANISAELALLTAR